MGPTQPPIQGETEKIGRGVQQTTHTIQCQG